MKFYCLTLFPEYIHQLVGQGVIGQAVHKGRLQVQAVNPRDFTEDIHRTVDGKPFGGGDGMVMMAEPLEKALGFVKAQGFRGPCFSMSPQGRRWDDNWARQLASNHQEILLVCGRYAGVDQRFVSAHIDAEISVGDYVLSGGEIPAAIVIETVGRLLPGVLGNAKSSKEESFAKGLLECPQMTRPREYAGLSVPEVLLSGDHAQIERVRQAVALLRTARLREDLNVGSERLRAAREIVEKFSENDLKCFGIERDWL